MKPIHKNLPEKLFNLSSSLLTREKIQNSLLEQVGNYCSYCEMPLSGYQVAHHKRFKAWQPQLTLSDWPDLLLICKDCREHITKEELSEEEAQQILWPDEHTPFTLQANSPLTYELRPVRYLVLDGDQVHSDEQMDLVFATPNFLAGQQVHTQAKATVDHFQLNLSKDYYQEASNTIVVPLEHHQQRLDNRIFARTETWKEAEAAIDRIQQIDALNDAETYGPIREMLLDQISSTAYFKGNWSIWMTVFNRSSYSNDHQLLHRLFLQDTRFFQAIKQENLGLNFKP